MASAGDIEVIFDVTVGAVSALGCQGALTAAPSPTNCCPLELGLLLLGASIQFRVIISEILFSVDECKKILKNKKLMNLHRVITFH